MKSLKITSILITLIVLSACELVPPDLPENQPIKKVVWLKQNWSEPERFWFHHATQGTVTLPVPYQWLVSLERPSLTLGDAGLLIEPEYMRRFGFIPSPKSLSDTLSDVNQGYTGENTRSYVAKGGYDYKGHDYSGSSVVENPDGLPVGFAKLDDATNPVTGAKIPDAVGFTCSACHTGQIEYNQISIRIDGAPAITDLDLFTKALGLSLVYTKYLPAKFDRFAERVLGKNHSKDQAKQLKTALNDKLDSLKQISELTSEIYKNDVEGGFSRLDALNRIGNQVFFEDLLASDTAIAKQNIYPRNAPVNYPHIWTTSWFDWVQYDASIMQPMVRNAGESLGVAALINLKKPQSPDNLYKSTSKLHEIFEMEQLLAGKNPTPEKRFQGLSAPKWPESILGRIDQAKKSHGEKLYKDLCQSCHLPPTDSEEFWDEKYWTTLREGTAHTTVLKVKQIPVEYIGTDPSQSEILSGRQVKVPEYLEIDPSSVWCGDKKDGPKPGIVTQTAFGFALGVAVEKTTNKWYEVNNITDPVQRERMNGNRPNCIKADPVYKARPLNGIWATAPFLHNSSIPNLYELLSPVAERSPKFYLGSRQYDPVKVGYEYRKISGAFLLDTSIKGNFNSGHEFNDGPIGKGVIGRLLTEEERYALVEYLKVL